MQILHTLVVLLLAAVDWPELGANLTPNITFCSAGVGGPAGFSAEWQVTIPSGLFRAHFLLRHRDQMQLKSEILEIEFSSSITPEVISPFFLQYILVDTEYVVKINRRIGFTSPTSCAGKRS